MKANVYRNRGLYKLIGAWCLLLAAVFFMQQHPDYVERYYSRAFYPVFSYLSIVLFAWVPFSVGDVLYGAALLIGGGYLVKCVRFLFVGNKVASFHYLLRLVAFVLFIYTYFYINWGLNYYRMPLAQQMGIAVADIRPSDHLLVLERYIGKANAIRDSLEVNGLSRNGVRMDMEELVRRDSTFGAVLSKSQIHAKVPLSSTLVSYFTVTGYFNPFTHEVQVNEKTPIPSYPFVVAHELAHQMGVGFEDECNFIAFCLLRDHEDPWYSYSAYYEAIQYLFRSLPKESGLYSHFRSLLSDKVRADFVAEREFWNKYGGFVNVLSGMFYNQYLKHNNQPEGVERYNMMSRLVVAYELKKDDE